MLFHQVKWDERCRPWQTRLLLQAMNLLWIILLLCCVHSRRSLVLDCVAVWLRRLLVRGQMGCSRWHVETCPRCAWRIACVAHCVSWLCIGIDLQLLVSAILLLGGEWVQRGLLLIRCCGRRLLLRLGCLRGRGIILLLLLVILALTCLSELI